MLTLLGSGSDGVIPSFDWVNKVGALALAGERGLSGESLSSTAGTGESLHSDSRSTSGGQVVRAEKSSGTAEVMSWEELSLGVGIETNQGRVDIGSGAGGDKSIQEGKEQETCDGMKR